jgi:hypothetical protein
MPSGEAQTGEAWSVSETHRGRLTLPRLETELLKALI